MPSQVEQIVADERERFLKGLSKWWAFSVNKILNEENVMYKDEIERIINKTAALILRGQLASAERADDLAKLCNFALQHAEERPRLTPVDLSVLIASGIDCEFGAVIPAFGPLTNVVRGNTTTIYHSEGRGSYQQCRPRMNHIHAWQGGECPLPEGVRVMIYFRCGDTIKGASDAHRWTHKGGGSDIIAFEVLGLAEGYCWPWECEG